MSDTLPCCITASSRSSCAKLRAENERLREENRKLRYILTWTEQWPGKCAELIGASLARQGGIARLNKRKSDL